MDEEAAAVVRRVYQMVIDGYGVNGIADILTADKVLIPAAYAKLNCPENNHTSALQDLILSAIREVSSFVRSDEKEFLHLVREETNAGIEIAAKEQKKQLHKAEKRIAELDGLIKKLYEGNATGKIPDKHFNRMLIEYDHEQFEVYP